VLTCPLPLVVPCTLALLDTLLVSPNSSSQPGQLQSVACRGTEDRHLARPRKGCPVTTRIVLLSVAEPVLVEQDTTEVLNRLMQPDPPLVALNRPGGKIVHLSRAAVALVEDAGDLVAEAALTTTATSGASVVREEGLTSSALA
jgi:hypothetical protein